jgi:preprotein translocase subunit YajC
MVPRRLDAYHAGSTRVRPGRSIQYPKTSRWPSWPNLMMLAIPFIQNPLLSLPLLLQAEGEGSEGQPDFFFMIAIILAIFWFVAILPERKQRKKKQAMMEEMKKNDRVLLTSGMYATIASIGEADVTIKFDDGPTRIKVVKSAIASVLDKDGNDSSKR